MQPAKPITAVLLLTAFAAPAAAMTPPDVPAAVAVPAGHTPLMTLKGVGQLAYECRAKADAAGAHEWVFVAPDAMLQDASGKAVGKYYGGPTWEHNDGGKITGKQLAVAAGAAGSIPLQLVQTAPASVTGAFDGVTYIQRVNTMGGVAPKAPCDGSTAGSRQLVRYSADYVFYKP